MLPPTQVHHHDWEPLGAVIDAPLQDGDHGTYQLFVCWYCQYVKPEPAETYLMSTNEHKEGVVRVLAEKHLVICFNGVES